MNLFIQHMIWFHVAAAKTFREPFTKKYSTKFYLFLKKIKINNEIKNFKSQRTDLIITPVLPTWSSSPALGSVHTRKTWQNVPSFHTTGSAKPATAKAGSWHRPATGCCGNSYTPRLSAAPPRTMQVADSSASCWPIHSWAPHIFYNWCSWKVVTKLGSICKVSLV